MRQPDQKMRFSDVELAQIKGIFAGNDDLIWAVRKHMLQYPLTDREKDIIEGLTETAHALLWKFFYPEIDGDSPLFQITDMHVGLMVDMKEKVPEYSWPYIQAKELEMAYIKQQLESLRDITKKPKILLSDMVKKRTGKSAAEKAFIGITARNYLLSYVDSNLQQIKFLAGLKEESVEETKKKLQQDSNK